MVYVFGRDEAERASLRAELDKFARSYYEPLTSVTVDHLEYPDLQASLGLEPGVFPAGAVHQLSKNHIYPYPRGQPITSRALQKWGLDVYQERVRPWTPTSSEPEPEPEQKKGWGTTRVNLNVHPGVKIRIAGRDEL